MTATIIMTVISVIGLAVNITTMFLTFPCKRSYRFSIITLVLFAVFIFSVSFLTDKLGIEWGGLRGVVFLPIMLLLFRGQIFQKIFAFFLQYLFTVLQSSLASEVIKMFIPVGSDEYYIILLISLVVLYSGYITLIFIYGRRIFQRLFVNSRQVEWALYAFGALFSYVLLTTYRLIPFVNGTLFTLTMLFILWSFCILCFAIINTHEKSKQKSDAEFARGIVSSGRDHYQKMDEMYEKLRILNHDYKHHLNAVRKMISSGSLEEADSYLTIVENGLSEHELRSYCSNSVLNALISSFADRCAKLDIKLDVKLDIPELLTIADYDMCIILGNLVENAVEACEKQQSGRIVELIVKPHGTQLIIVVKNSFDGNIAQADEMPVSTKKDGGLGLKSVQAVAARYGGEMLTEWDNKTFTAYVYMGL